ncbi:MAG: AAA family ATPase [Roseateles sp.]|uniref:AAA family ATPase n=1 Tax=Roseateles sp. TaxID=1971397 RepID=UPI0040351CF6
MKIEIIGWRSQGFRCPDMEVSFKRENTVPKVALIQMPNGTGKTTTLNLLKATLTGEAKDWGPARIGEFRRAGDSNSTGKFSVELRIDDRALKLELTLDFDFGQTSYTTQSPDVGGFNAGWTPPSNVRRFLTRRFVDLFIFDGELANRLLNPEESRAEEAIEALGQLDLLDEVRNGGFNELVSRYSDNRPWSAAEFYQWYVPEVQKVVEQNTAWNSLGA